MKNISRSATSAIAILLLPTTLSGCLAVSVAGDVVEGAVNVTGDVAEGAVNATGSVVGAAIPDGDEDDDEGDAE